MCIIKLQHSATMRCNYRGADLRILEACQRTMHLAYALQMQRRRDNIVGEKSALSGLNTHMRRD